MRIGKDKLEEDRNKPEGHDYHVETEICTVTDKTKTWCTLENIACWGRHYPAPHQDESNHEKPVTNGAVSKLGQCAVVAGRRVCVPKEGGNPIRTMIGTEGKLPEHAIANTTLEGHIFHDPNNPEGCPKKLNDGDWKTSPSNGCSQVYREPHLQKNSKIVMRTRGFGSGGFRVFNNVQGPPIFRELNQRMLGAMNKAPGRICPELQTSE